MTASQQRQLISTSIITEEVKRKHFKTCTNENDFYNLQFRQTQTIDTSHHEETYTIMDYERPTLQKNHISHSQPKQTPMIIHILNNTHHVHQQNVCL